MNLDKRLLQQVWDVRFKFVLTILIGIAAGVLVVYQAYTLSMVVNAVFINDQNLAQVAGLLRILLGVMVLRALIAWSAEWVAGAIAIKIKTDLRSALFSHLLDLGPVPISAEQSGELSNTQIEGVEALDAYYSQYLPQLILSAAVPVLMLIFVFQIDLLSALILLLTAPLIPFFLVLIGNVAQAQTRKQWNTLSKMNAYFLDVLAGLKTLKSLGRSRAQANVIARVSERYREVTMSVLRITFLSALVLEMVATLSTAVIAVQIGLRLLYGRMEFQDAFFILLLAPEFYLPLRMLGAKFHAGMTGVAAAERIFEVLELGEGNQRGAKNQFEAVDSQVSLSSFSRIEFREASYAYREKRKALRNVSFEIEAGRRVAMVGSSGSGKSTVAALLMRFIEPTEGQIFVDGQDISVISAQSWRSQIAWLSQEPTLFYGTVADNIRLGRPQASMADVIYAAGQAGADGFISDLPKGYNTLLGEQGSGLSAGQAQRIALARAFLKDAPLLILDEPTANLDPITEAKLGGVLDQLLEGRTALIIAHRLNTCIDSDEILVLDHGNLVEKGDHDTLLARGGYYKKMIDMTSLHLGQWKQVQVKWENTIMASRVGRVSYRVEEQYGSLIPEITPKAITADVSEEQFEQNRRIGFNVLRRLIGFMAPYKWQVALATSVGFATVLSGIGLLTTSAYLISAAALQTSIADLQVAIVGVRFFGIGRGVFRYLERYLSHQVTFRLLARLRVWFYRALEPLAPARLMEYRRGDLLTRIQNDIESLQNFYIRAFYPPLVAILVGVVVVFFLSIFDPRFGIVTAVFMILVGLGVPIGIHILSRWIGREMIIQRGYLNSTLVEGIHGLADLIAYGRENDQLGKVITFSERLGRLQMSMARITGTQIGMSQLARDLCMWTVLVLAIPMVNEKQLAGVNLAVVVLAVLSSFEAVMAIPQAAQQLEGNLAAADRLDQVVSAAPAVQEPLDPLPLPGTLNLEAELLTFQYPPRQNYTNQSRNVKSDNQIQAALCDLSFSLPYGKVMAVVGPSGSGKTTLVNLLLRFWELERGRIEVEGEDIRQFDPYEWRGVLGVVGQDSYLFNASVLENLLIAKPDATRSEIFRAAEKAQIHEFLQSLPEGYDTNIGERGTQLSGGERQRLLIARAFLRDAPILILDEPTVNLDAVTEWELIKTIFDATQNQTLLIVTHRLVGMDRMDEILVLRDGWVIERGDHKSLMARGGYYQRMWNLQHQELIETI